MSIYHDGFAIKGLEESPVPQPPRFEPVRSKFAGLRGESEINVRPGGRLITCVITLHGGWTSIQNLFDHLQDLDNLVGRHGTLQFRRENNRGQNRDFNFCTFEGFQQASGPDAGPLPDLVGMLDNQQNTWWVRGVLAWYQLYPYY